MFYLEIIFSEFNGIWGPKQIFLVCMLKIATLMGQKKFLYAMQDNAFQKKDRKIKMEVHTITVIESPSLFNTFKKIVRNRSSSLGIF